MPVTRWILGLAALSLACAGWMRGAGGDERRHGTPIFEIDSVTYDGSELNARALVGARDGPVVVDRRFEEGITVDVREVRDCASGAPISSLIEDVLLPEATGQDIVELRPGQWIGAEEHFFLFSPTLTGGLGPDCIRVRLVLFLTPMRPGGDATLEIEARRTGLSRYERDGGEDAGQADAGQLDAGPVEGSPPPAPTP